MSAVSGLARAALPTVRVLFLVAAAAFAGWGLVHDWSQITAALQEVSLGQDLISAVLVLTGVGLTGLLWTKLLRQYGYPLSLSTALPVFFVGQLGKYIPGSLWSLAAQAEMAAAVGVPMRVTVTTGLLFLWVNVASATAVGGVCLLSGELTVPVPALAVALICLAAVVALTPWALREFATRVADSLWRPHSPIWFALSVAGLMLLTWSAYGVAVLALLPGGVPVSAAIGAFAISYVAGVLVIVAPAGVGVREVVLIALLDPLVGLGPSVVAALLSRFLLVAADFALAGLTWSVRRFAVVRDPGQ